MPSDAAETQLGSSLGKPTRCAAADRIGWVTRDSVALSFAFYVNLLGNLGWPRSRHRPHSALGYRPPAPEIIVPRQGLSMNHEAA
jgi:hypothetical protein